jgi:mono/diheme cytochrome c family protein
MSLVIINGILSFMLTPGKWIETRSFWDGFFNPSYFPSLVIRAAITIALAGVYAMFTGSFESDALKQRIVRNASIWMMVSVPVLLIGALWYQFTLPRLSLHIVSGGAPVVMIFAGLSVLFSVLIFPFAYLIGYRQPQHFSPAIGALFLVLALLVTAVTEWVREAVRKPYIIYGYMYSNAILKEDMDIYRTHGFLPVAKWATIREFDPSNESETLRAGAELFKGQCQHCHTVEGFNGITALVYGWSKAFTYEQLGRLNELKAFMPPFVGTDAERRALAKWLAGLNPPHVTEGQKHNAPGHDSYTAESR